MQRQASTPPGRSFERLIDVRRVAIALAVVVVISAIVIFVINRLWIPISRESQPVRNVAATNPNPAAASTPPAAPPLKSEARGQRAVRAEAAPATPPEITPRRGDAPTVDRRTTPVASPPAAPVAATPPEPATQPAPPDTVVYTTNDRDVVPPVVLWPQQLGRIPTAGSGDKTLIEVVVNSDGTVAQVRAQQSPQTLDDAMILTMSLSAAKSWLFRPALKNGRPVRYRQVIPVSLR